MQRKTSQALTRQLFPHFVACGDISPRSGENLSRKGEPLKNGNLTVLPKSSPFGRAGIEQGEMTERV